jgi:hypothetical protein
MKHLRNFATFLLIVASMMTLAQGQAGAPGIKLTVPFSFVIGRSAFSAGVYSIYSVKNKVWVQEASGRNIAVLFSEPLDGEVPQQDGKVIFDCYSEECFLSQVWIAGQDSGRTLPRSKRHVHLASTGVSQQFALLGRKARR